MPRATKSTARGSLGYTARCLIGQGSEGDAEAARLRAEVAKLRADLDRQYVRGVQDGQRRVRVVRGATSTTGAIYGEKVAKLLNLVIGASPDPEAVAAFEKARKLHAKQAA